MLALGAVAALLVALLPASAPDHDAIQAIGAARSLLAGQGFSSPIVYYEMQHALGPAVPVPQTVFPPAGAWAIAVLLALGVPAAFAPALVAIAALLASAELLRRLLGAAGCPPTLAVAVGVAWLVHPRAWELARAGATEPLFVAALLLCALAVTRAGDGARPWTALAVAGAAGALAVTVRYVGVVPVAAIAAATYLALRSADRVHAAVAATIVGAPAAIAAGALFLRNRLLTGRASGGQFEHPIPPDLAAALEALGEAARQALGVPGLPGAGPAALALGLAVGAAGLGWGLWVSARGAAPRRGEPDATGQAAADAMRRAAARGVLACAAAALAQAAFFAWNTATVAPWFASWRYLLPLLPMLLAVAAVLACGALGASRARRLGPVALVAVAALGIACGLRETRITSPLAEARAQVEAALDARCGDGTVRARLAARPPDEPLLSTEEHLLHLATGRPVLGTTSRNYTSRTWTAAEVAEAMDRFGAHEVLVVPPALARRAPAFVGQPFHAVLAAGGVPEGFEPVCDGPAVRVLRRLGAGG